MGGSMTVPVCVELNAGGDLRLICAASAVSGIVALSLALATVVDSPNGTCRLDCAASSVGVPRVPSGVPAGVGVRLISGTAERRARQGIWHAQIQSGI
jgi:hypothetical protein